jgi:hypothetical protein
MGNPILSAVSRSWDVFRGGVEQFFPRVLAMLAIVLVGWLIATILRWVLSRGLKWARLDALAERAGVAALLKTADLPEASALVGAIVFWLVWIGFLLSGIEALGLTVLEGVVGGFVQFLPRLLLAIAILVVGALVANFAWRATLLAGVNAHLPSARLLARGVRALILIFAGAMALEHIAVAQTVVLTAFAITFGAVMLGLAIAFGIGGSRLAERLLDQQFAKRPGPGPDEVTHV